METQLLIEELSPSVCNLVQEFATDGGTEKHTWLSGIFMQSDITNRNGRSYPLTEIAAAVKGAAGIIKETNGIFGELDHPQSLTINLDRISHVITEMRMEGNNAIGRAKILPTPMGDIAKVLVESGVALGVSSRGTGAVNESGGVSGFNFITVDIVATPSAPEAYPNSIYESLELAKNGHNIMNLAEQVRHDVAAQKYLKKEITNWLNTNVFAKK